MFSLALGCGHCKPIRFRGRGRVDGNEIAAHMTLVAYHAQGKFERNLPAALEKEKPDVETFKRNQGTTRLTILRQAGHR